MSAIASTSSPSPSIDLTTRTCDRITCENKISTLFLGAQQLLIPLREQLDRSQLSGKWIVELDPMYNEAEVIFGRDFRVIRHDGSHLLPSMLCEKNLDFKFLAYLPINCRQIAQYFHRAGYGKGFSEEYIDKKEKVAKDLGLSHEVGRSVLEGGNCLIFKNAEGQQRSIVGLSSVSLTLINLEDSGYFLENSERIAILQSTIDMPSEDFLRMAKNKNLLEEFLPLYDEMLENRSKNPTKFMELQTVIRQRFGGITGVKMEMMAPISSSDIPTYKDKAKELQAKWSISQEVIAEDLQLPLDSIGFIPQLDFHIDLSIFVAPGGKVFIHDEEQVLSLLPERSKNKQIESYRKQSESQYLINRKWKLSCADEIVKLGGEPIFVPGKLEGFANSSIHPINLMNAVLLDDESRSLVITAQSGVETIDQIFSQLVTGNIPSCELLFLDERLMSTLLRETSAGLHCITWENKS
ncbi:MAG: hypothetical protein FJZ57_03865 [Chlamydiae bacterium]|nr:hypothetical protein [Chlamydiota bacterium]